MSLKEIMASDALNVFLNTDEFAETVTFYPYGDPSRAIETPAIVIQDDLEGTREAHGDGVVLRHDAGTAVRESYRVECLASIDVSATRRPADLVKIEDGTMLLVKRIMGRDTDGLCTVWCVKRDDVTVRRPTRSG